MSKSAKEMVLGGSSILLAAAATTILADRLTASGDLLVPKSVLTGAGTALLGLLSYLLILWKRDCQRERVRFARESGRRICTCTEIGEIMIADPRRSTATQKVEVCRSCKREKIIQIGAA